MNYSQKPPTIMARSIYFILVLFLAFGCSKEDDTPSGSSGPAPGGSEYGFEAMVDTVLVQIPISEVSATLITGNAGNVPDFFDITLEAGANESFLVRQVGEPLTMADIQTGPVENFTLAYNLNGESWFSERNNLVPPGYIYPPDEPVGEVVFTEVSSTYVKGTFSFTGKNPVDESLVVVTDGHFYAEIE